MPKITDYTQRMQICKRCPSYQPTLARCKECGCFLGIKARVKSTECPLDKWKTKTWQ